MGAAWDVAIVSSGHDVADARIHKIVAAFVARGLRVEVFGVGDPAYGPAGAQVHAEPRGSMTRRIRRALRLPGRTCARVLFTVDPDVIIPARLHGMLRRRPVVVDIHEDYAKLLRDRAWARGLVGLAGRAVAGAATIAARGADLTVVTDEFVPPVRAKHRVVVRNLPAPALMGDLAPRDARPRAVYVGDLRRSRGLFDMLDAVAAAPGWELDLVGPVAPADEAQVRQRLADDALDGRVRLHGRLPPAQAWAVASGSWAGLLLLQDTPAFREAMPTKLYEYMALGMPVLTTPLPRQAAVVRASGAGLVVDGAQAAGQALRDWAADPATVDRQADAALAWVKAELAADDPYGRLADLVATLAGTAAGP